VLRGCGASNLRGKRGRGSVSSLPLLSVPLEAALLLYSYTTMAVCVATNCLVVIRIFDIQTTNSLYESHQRSVTVPPPQPRQRTVPCLPSPPPFPLHRNQWNDGLTSATQRTSLNALRCSSPTLHLPSWHSSASRRAPRTVRHAPRAPHQRHFIHLAPSSRQKRHQKCKPPRRAASSVFGIFSACAC
jgi:hypothetical protein